VVALGRGGGTSSLPAVVAALRDSAGPVRQAAAYALGERAVAERCRFGPAPPGPLAGPIAALAAALDDPFYGARHAAAEALGRAGAPATAAAAEAALGRGPLARRVLAIHALGAGGDPRAAPILAAIRDAAADSTALDLEARVALVRLGQSWEAPAGLGGGGAAALRIDEAAARAGAHSASSTQHLR
jgi:HEAT repeat protein